MSERLFTKDRMQSFHMHVNQDCLLCGSAIESHQLLFCDCNYSRTVLRACPLNVTLSWLEMGSGRLLTSTSDHVRTNIAYLYISVAFYNIWKESNYRMHSPGLFTQPPIIVRRIQETVRNRLFSCEAFSCGHCTA